MVESQPVNGIWWTAPDIYINLSKKLYFTFHILFPTVARDLYYAIVIRCWCQYLHKCHQDVSSLRRRLFSTTIFCEEHVMQRELVLSSAMSKARLILRYPLAANTEAGRWHLGIVVRCSLLLANPIFFLRALMRCAAMFTTTLRCGRSYLGGLICPLLGRASHAWACPNSLNRNGHDNYRTSWWMSTEKWTSIAWSRQFLYVNFTVNFTVL